MEEGHAVQRPRPRLRPRSGPRSRPSRGCARLAAVAAVACAAVAASSAAGGGAAAQAPAPVAPTVVAFPSPGTTTASPRTEISLRGVAPEALGAIEVRGSRSGAFRLRVAPHSDGRGASLLLDRPARAGERLSVSTRLHVVGARNGDWSITTVPRPAEGLGSGSVPPRSLARQLFGQRGRTIRAGGRYASRPDLRPVGVDITRAAQGRAPGLTFVAPKKVYGARQRRGVQHGPLALDGRGEPVWFAPLPDGTINDLRVQRFRGRPVLSWWQGRQVLGSGEGVVQLLDERYQPVARVRGGNGYALDFHETTITARDTLLGLVYNPVPWDLRPVGGARDGRAVEAVVQEIDIATGRVLFEWHSLQDIPVTDGYGRRPASRRQPYDYFHVNSVAEDADGHLLVSARDAHVVVKLDRGTGRVLWRLGGRRSSFRMPRDARPAWQHDAQRAPDGTLRIFDNQAAPRLRPRSRVLWLRLDERRMTASIARQYEHPAGLSAGTQGNAQALPTGGTFIGWGSQGWFTELDRRGRVVFDGRLARGADTYRAYRAPWRGRPLSRPALHAVRHRGRRTTTVRASWNGATGVASWQVLAGGRVDRLRPVGARRRTGFETTIRVTTGARYVAVRARDARGRTLRTSVAERVRDARS